MDDFSDLKATLKNFEGCVSYMYLDTTGHVTVGVGHMLGCCGDAEKLSFVLRQGATNAAVGQIAEDFNRVSAQQQGQLFTHYEQFTQLDMLPTAIEALLDSDIAEKDQALQQCFKGYDTYPSEAKSALLDMAFNLGVPGLVAKFPHLKAAAEAGDWNTCANECERIGVQQNRNVWTKQQFQTAGLAAWNKGQA